MKGVLVFVLRSGRGGRGGRRERQRAAASNDLGYAYYTAATLRTRTHVLYQVVYPVHKIVYRVYRVNYTRKTEDRGPRKTRQGRECLPAEAMVDRGGEWTFGSWYEAEPTAVQTFKGWETSGKVGELQVSSRAHQSSGGRSVRSKLCALRSEQVNLNHCFRRMASATAAAPQPPPRGKGGPSPGVITRGESTFASRHRAQLRLQRLQAAVNELDRLDILAQSMSLGTEPDRPRDRRSCNIPVSPVKRKRKLKRYLPFKNPGHTVTGRERELEKVVDARQTIPAVDVPDDTTSLNATSKSSTAHLFSSMAENFILEQKNSPFQRREQKKIKIPADSKRKIETTSNTETTASRNFIPSSGPLTTLFGTEVVSRIHGFLAEQQIGPLMKATGYSRFQLYGHFMRFKALCTMSKSPEGIDRKAFGSGVPSLSVEDSLFVDRIFNVVDTERRGLLDWPHYIKAMSALEQGTPDARTAFLFQVYDTGGDGGISREELRHFFVSSLMTEADSFVEGVADIFVEGVFSRINANEKGDLTLPEALRYIDNTDDVVDLHGMFGRSMAMQGFETVVDGKNKAGQETKKQKEARKIRKLRRDAGNNLSLRVTTSKKGTGAAGVDSSSHAAQLIHAIDQIGPSSVGAVDGCNNEEQEEDGEKNSDLANMHRKIVQASLMSPTARRRRASVVFMPAKSVGSCTPQIELKPLGKYYAGTGSKGPYMLA